jgi:hypothetical protein
MKAIRALEDGDGHWYLVPNELSSKFSELSNKIDEDGEDFFPALEEFEKLFNEFRTGGDLNNTQLYIE